MLEVSDRAAEELTRVLNQSMAGARQSVRLGLDRSGGLSMTIDTPHAGDILVRRYDAVLLIVEGRLSPLLANRVLDIPAGEVGTRRNFTLSTKPALLDR
jgi:hypothetical protein